VYEPILGEKLDILQKAFSEMEADIVRAAFANSHGSADVGASYQEEIKSTYHIIVYNMYLKEQDLAQKPILQLDIDYLGCEKYMSQTTAVHLAASSRA